MNKLVKIFIPTGFTLTLLILWGFLYASFSLPQNYTITETETENGNLSINMFPFSLSASTESNAVKASNITSENSYNYTAQLKFLNLLPVKTVNVNVSPQQYVMPCGTPFGVKIYTEGVMVIGISEVWTETGAKSPGKLCGLQKGDIIMTINSCNIKNNEDLEKIIQDSEGENLQLSVRRDNSTLEMTLTPLKSYEEEKFRAGIWVRDSSAGIGTLTFINKEKGCFAGLGHGICDVDTGDILPLSKGNIVEAVISDVRKGQKGYAGELKGCFIGNDSLGEILTNNEIGLYGKLNTLPYDSPEIEIAMKQDVKKGPAQILTTIEGNKPNYYDINIDSINYNINSPTKNIKISVTDSTLLKKTGGIVQGMSGSPIIQNNKLVGAVTHVFVNNPAEGYAIFSETMLTNSNKVFCCEYKKTS